MNNPIWHVHQAVFHQLTNNQEIAEVAKGVFQYVPRGTNYPYVVIAGLNMTPWPTLYLKGYEMGVTIRCYDRAESSKTCSQLVSLARESLVNLTFPETGPLKLSNSFWQESNLTMNSSGTVWKGTVFGSLLCYEKEFS